jgi:hypothetical protein
MRTGNVACRGCGATIRVFEDEIGTEGTCPRCGVTNTVDAAAFAAGQEGAAPSRAPAEGAGGATAGTQGLRPDSPGQPADSPDAWSGGLELEEEHAPGRAQPPGANRRVVGAAQEPSRLPLRSARLTPRQELEEEGPGILAPLLWFLELFPGLVRPSVLVMSILMVPIAGFVSWLGFFLLTLGGLIAGFMIAGFGLVIYWTALSWIIYGYICLPSEALAEFEGAQWTVFLLLGFAPIVGGFLLMGMSG